MALHKLKIDEGLYLDNFLLQGVKAYKVNHEENEDLACLTLEMDVSLLSNKVCSQFDSFFNQEGYGTGSER